jgi:hypothetical protein
VKISNGRWALRKKNNRQNAVLIKEKLDKTGIRLEHLPHISPDMISSTCTGFDNSSMESD